uniref:VOC family protein n=1 Tax=Acidobacterium capsulatum TaxID=33075 RepID=A0A7V4XQV3_9BACT
MSTIAPSPRITPFLWFDNNAEEAASFYVGIFPNSRILDTVPNHPGTSPSAAKVITVNFELDGIRFTALNGGPQFPFNESVSFVVHCATQQEIDYYWERLTAEGGSEVQCGWLKDKYGVSWQVVPAHIAHLIRSRNVMLALMQMKKLDIATLERAAQE